MSQALLFLLCRVSVYWEYYLMFCKLIPTRKKHVSVKMRRNMIDLTTYICSFTSKSALTPTVVYSTALCQAGVLASVLLFVALWFILRGDLF